MNTSLFSEWVKGNRLARGWQISDLASKCGMSNDAVQQAERCSLRRVPHISTVERYCSAFQLDVRRERSNLGMPSEVLTAHQHEVLEGLMLGDGHLCKKGRLVNPYLTIGRAGYDHHYQEWLGRVFNPYTNQVELYSRFQKRLGKIYTSSILRTRCSESLSITHSRWYQGKTKIVPLDLELTPLAIAVWVADDGQVIGRKLRKGKLSTIGRPSFSMTISTCGFSFEDNCRLCALLNARYGGGFRVDRFGKYWKIGCATKGTRELLREIDSVFPPLDRKSRIWRPSIWENEPRCEWCRSGDVLRQGSHSNGKRRWSCKSCGHRFTPGSRKRPLNS